MIDLSNYFCINWDNHLTFLFCSVNMGNYINIFSNVKSKLYSWVNSIMVRMHSFKCIAWLGWLLFCLGFLYLCLWVKLACYWFIDLFFSICFSHSVIVTWAATRREFPLLCYRKVCVREFLVELEVFWTGFCWEDFKLSIKFI